MNLQVCVTSVHIGLIESLANLQLVLKHNRVTEIATENRLPVIGIVQAVSI